MGARVPTRAAFAAPAVAAAAAVLCAFGCGAGSPRRAPASATSARPLAGAPLGPAFGLTEDNADLLFSPQAPARPGGAAFQAARSELTALHPSYIRLLVDWAALAAQAGRAPALAGELNGCARGVGPCGPYAGIREELAAIASQQRAAGGGFRVVIVIFGAPAWAAAPASGCEGPGTRASSRALRPSAIGAYRALIGSLLSLAASEGVALEWWSPWNEPNDPRFISPQRARCDPGSPPLAPAVYGELARAMAAELRAHGGEHHLLLGELADLQADSPRTTSIASFVAALPADVICLGQVWSVHAYASRAPDAPAPEAVGALEAALEERGGCGREAAIWVTEAGTGTPHPGDPRPAGPAEEEAGCLALAAQLLGWYSDPRVGAVLQYSFREDPAFPVGLVSADLSHLYPAYRLWLAYSRLRAAGEPPPSPAAGCA